MKKKEFKAEIERQRGYANSFYNQLKEIRLLYYKPMREDEKMKEMAVDFGKFLITMKVTAVSYPTLFKTNCGMSPDMIIETMEAMYDRHLESKIPFEG